MSDSLFQTCPHCGAEDIVVSWGSRTSPILIIGSEPEEGDQRTGKPLTKSSPIFKAELSRAGLDYNRMRVCLLINHTFPKDTHDKCLEWSVMEAIKEAKNRKVVVTMGATSSKYFTGFSTGTHNGLVTSSLYLSGAKVMICVKPSSIFGAGLGELHFAIKSLKQLLKDEGIE